MVWITWISGQATCATANLWVLSSLVASFSLPLGFWCYVSLLFLLLSFVVVALHPSGTLLSLLACVVILVSFLQLVFVLIFSKYQWIWFIHFFLSRNETVITKTDKGHRKTGTSQDLLEVKTGVTTKHGDRWGWHLRNRSWEWIGHLMQHMKNR